MRTTVLAFITFWLISGCTTATLMTSPICEAGQWDLPAEYEGDYSLAFEMQSTDFSGSLVASRQKVSIQSDGKTAQVYLHNPQAAVMKMVKEKVAYVSICEISGDLYYQESHPAGYTVSKLNLGPDFFDMAAIVFHPDTLKARGIPFYFLPQLEAENVLRPESEAFPFNLLSPLKIVVDNRHVEAETLIANGQPLSITTSLHRIIEAKTYDAQWVRIR